MSGEMKAVIICLITASLSLIFIVIIDVAGGVPFNYAVPIAFTAALFPFAVLYWRQRSLRSDATDAHARDLSPHYAKATPIVPRRRDTTVATIHSIVMPTVIPRQSPASNSR